MKKLIPLVSFVLTCLAASAATTPPQPLATITFRGEVIPVFSADQQIQPTKHVLPEHPGRERLAQIQGRVMLTLLVGADGKVAEVDILSSEPKASFGQAARAAALQWEYEPLMQDGRPTSFIVQEPVSFVISDDYNYSMNRPVPASFRSR
jgi:TonB family protein